jgi:hypothetical protein
LVRRREIAERPIEKLNELARGVDIAIARGERRGRAGGRRLGNEKSAAEHAADMLRKTTSRRSDPLSRPDGEPCLRDRIEHVRRYSGDGLAPALIGHEVRIRMTGRRGRRAALNRPHGLMPARSARRSQLMARRSCLA